MRKTNEKPIIYITGHRNPDMDSMCSAFAYAALKNQIDPENEYIPVRCGHVTESGKKIFEYVGMTAPRYLRDVFPKTADIYLTSDHKNQLEDPLNSLAERYDEHSPSVFPVFDGDAFVGLLSIDDISTWVMRELGEKGSIHRVPSLRELMTDQEPYVLTTDLFDEAKAQLSSSKKRGLAVYDENGYVGFITRRCFLKAPKHSLILVDHNEPKQSIMGIETATIVEILDHHRLDAVKTDLPIFIDAEPIGSTCTIVYRQFLLHGLKPDPQIARVLLTGLVSDTLILRSPTTTPIDKKAAEDLCKIAGVDLQEFGLAIFSCSEGLKNRKPEEAISSDFKMYSEKDVKFGIGQCEVTTLHDLDDYCELYLEKLEETRKASGLDWAVLMITDVLEENSVLLTTSFRTTKHLQYKQKKAGIYDMPGVMSRKKQLLPELLMTLGM